MKEILIISHSKWINMEIKAKARALPQSIWIFSMTSTMNAITWLQNSSKKSMLVNAPKMNSNVGRVETLQAELMAIIIMVISFREWLAVMWRMSIRRCAWNKISLVKQWVPLCKHQMLKLLTLYYLWVSIRPLITITINNSYNWTQRIIKMALCLILIPWIKNWVQQ